MKKEELSDLPDDKLIKRRNLLNGILIGMYIVCVILLALLFYLFFIKGFHSVSMATLIPIFILPFITLPLFFQVQTLNKEMKTRNLK